MRLYRSFQKRVGRLLIAINDRRVDFVVAGTQKGGTTALDAYLRTHPQIGMADKKEVHFFNTEKNFQAPTQDYWEYHRHFAHLRGKKIWGEATPMYMYWRSAPERIKTYNPRMKIIILLRNPVERAFSHWNMERQFKVEPLSFWDGLHAEPERAKSKLPFQDRNYSYTARGFYTEQLERVWKSFPREQTLILKSEQLRDEPQAALDTVCDFLGVHHFSNVEKKSVHKRAYESGMGDREKKHLQNLFAPDIKKLEQMLGWDCRDWLAD